MYERIGEVIREACAAAPLGGSGLGHSSGEDFSIYAVRCDIAGWLVVLHDERTHYCEPLTHRMVEESGYRQQGLREVVLPDGPFADEVPVPASFLCGG